MGVQEVKSTEEWHTLVEDPNSDKVIFVDFTATWCGPCRMISPVFHELSEQYPDCIFLKVDVDQLAGVAEKAKVTAMPTFQVYHQGVMLKDFIGASKEGLQALVAKFAKVPQPA